MILPTSPYPKGDAQSTFTGYSTLSMDSKMVPYLFGTLVARRVLPTLCFAVTAFVLIIGGALWATGVLLGVRGKRGMWSGGAVLLAFNYL